MGGPRVFIARIGARAVHGLVLLLLYAVVASGVVESYAYKWTTIAVTGQTLTDYVLRTVERPYVYRVLTPVLLGWLDDVLPPGLRADLIARADRTQRMFFWEFDKAWPDSELLYYGVSLAADFLFLLGFLFLLRAMARAALGLGGVLLDASPILFGLLLPLTFRPHNGFPYDFEELFLLGLYVLLCYRRGGSIWTGLASPIVVAVAVVNKETALLFPLFGLAISFAGGRFRKDAANLGLQAMAAIAGYIVIHWIYRNWTGTDTIFHFASNVRFWLSPRPWRLLTTPHFPMALMPRASNMLVLALLAVTVLAYARRKPARVMLPLAVAGTINIPLFILFSYRDEMRNLSLMYPFLHLSALETVRLYFAEATLGRRAG